MVKRKTKRRRKVKTRPPRIFERKGKLYIIIGKKKFLINPKPSSLKNDYTKRELLDIILKKMRVKRRRKKRKPKTLKETTTSDKEFKELEDANKAQSQNIISALTSAKTLLPDINLETRLKLKEKRDKDKEKSKEQDKTSLVKYTKDKKQLEDEIKKLQSDIDKKKITFKKGVKLVNDLNQKVNKLKIETRDQEMERRKINRTLNATKNKLEKSHFDLLYSSTANKFNQMKRPQLISLVKRASGNKKSIPTKDRGNIFITQAKKEELKDFIYQNFKSDVDFINIVSPDALEEYEEQKEERGLLEEKEEKEIKQPAPWSVEDLQKRRIINQIAKITGRPKSQYEDWTIDELKQRLEGLEEEKDIDIPPLESEPSSEDEARRFLEETLEEQKREMIGDGVSNGGLSTGEILKMMKPYTKKGFVGVIPSDYVDKIDPKRKFAFIMNTDPSSKKGKHWVGVFIDTKHDMSIEYYDSFGVEPSKDFLKRIKLLIDKMKINVYLKLKVNKIKQQSSSTDNCGFFAMRFIMNRLDGKPFKFCSGFNDVKNGEEKIQLLKQKFGYI